MFEISIIQGLNLFGTKVVFVLVLSLLAQPAPDTAAFGFWNRPEHVKLE
jgi:hypothetical protein